jgi:hypothetical protein
MSRLDLVHLPLEREPSYLTMEHAEVFPNQMGLRRSVRPTRRASRYNLRGLRGTNPFQLPVGAAFWVDTHPYCLCSSRSMLIKSCDSF